MMSGAGISAVVRTERGEQVSGAVRQPLAYDWLLAKGDSAADFPMLFYVDRYGDTVFNRRQVEAVLAEIAVLRSREPSEDRRRAMDDLAYLCHLACQSPHRYLWLLGD